MSRTILVVAIALLHGAQAFGAEIVVAVDRTTGIIKPVNGVGQPPMLGGPSNFRMMHYLTEAGIPYSRLHDVGGAFGGSRYVDIPNVFPDFNADENDPKNYDFAFTDRLLLALEEAGVEPFYRLGVTIENDCAIKAYRILPPEDFGKWARVAEHVILHYTEGWANGFKMKIGYWEIWNEPDNFPDPLDNCMWRGNWESFLRFYGTVAPYLKAKFPHLKIGGYGSCGFYAAVGAKRVEAANSSPRLVHFVDCFTNFLDRAKAEGWPLDFFSFHSYDLPDGVRGQIAYARRTLDGFGFADAEMSFNEWLPHPALEALGTARQAALIAAELVDLQNGPCDTAMVYDARCGVGSSSPLFNPRTQKPHTAYYAVLGFNEQRKTGSAVAAASSDSKVRVAAAKGGKGSVVMMVNASDVEEPLTLRASMGEGVSCRITDADRTWKEDSLPTKLPPWSFVVLTVPSKELQ